MINIFAEIDERFEIIRRNLDRMQFYFEKNTNSVGIDYCEHLRNEITYLEQAVNKIKGYQDNEENKF